MRNLALLLAGAALIAAAPDTSPRKSTFRPFSWRESGVGSWAAYKLSIEFDLGGGNPSDMEYTLKLLVKAISDTEVTLEQTMRQNGAKIQTQVVKQPVDSSGWNIPQLGGEVKAEGREILLVAGRRIPCTWKEIETKQGGFEMTYRVWISHQVPTGIVKTTSKAEGQMNYEMTMELTEFERK